MIKAIIFDCFGVLTVKDNWQEFWASLPTPAATQTARELNQAYNRSEITEDQLMEGLSKLMNRPIAEVRQLLSTNNAKNKQMVQYAGELKNRGFKTAILSNIGDNWILDEFLTGQEQKFFDDMIFSFQVGMTKPDPAIFKLVCERLKVLPSEAVLIDDIDRYCAAASKAGLNAIVCGSTPQVKKDLEKLLADSNN